MPGVYVLVESYVFWETHHVSRGKHIEKSLPDLNELGKHFLPDLNEHVT